MYLTPYYVALKDRFSNIQLSDDTDVLVNIENPQHASVKAVYPAIGISYVYSELNRGDRLATKELVTKDLNTGTAIVRRSMEPIDIRFYIHTYTKDSMSQEMSLQQKVVELLPYTFTIPVTQNGYEYAIQCYREQIMPVEVEGLDREAHTVYEILVWGYLDTDPIGKEEKLVTDVPTITTGIK